MTSTIEMAVLSLQIERMTKLTMAADREFKKETQKRIRSNSGKSTGWESADQGSGSARLYSNFLTV